MVCICVHVWVGVHMHVDARIKPGSSSRSTHPIFGVRVSYWGLRPMKS